MPVWDLARCQDGPLTGVPVWELARGVRVGYLTGVRPDGPVASEGGLGRPHGSGAWKSGRRSLGGIGLLAQQGPKGACGDTPSWGQLGVLPGWVPTQRAPEVKLCIFGKKNPANIFGAIVRISSSRPAFRWASASGKPSESPKGTRWG